MHGDSNLQHFASNLLKWPLDSGGLRPERRAPGPEQCVTQGPFTLEAFSHRSLDHLSPTETDVCDDSSHGVGSQRATNTMRRLKPQGLFCVPVLTEKSITVRPVINQIIPD